MSEIKKNENIEDDDYDYLGNAACVGDCTGLIPEGEVKEEELEDYQEIYQFGAPKADWEAEKADKK